jgi:hypothetical protein
MYCRAKVTGCSGRFCGLWESSVVVRSSCALNSDDGCHRLPSMCHCIDGKFAWERCERSHREVNGF